MRILHASRLTEFRRPCGACPAGGAVSFILRIWPDGGSVKNVAIAYAYGLYTFQTGCGRLAVKREQDGQAAGADPAADAAAGPAADAAVLVDYQIDMLMPAEPGLLFYWFEIETASGTIYYTWDRDAVPGSGLTSASRPRYLPGEAHAPAAWQITLYDPAFRVPEWLTGAVIYQIFPDRFHRDQAFSPLRFAAVNQPERIFHMEWNEDVDIAGRPETGYIACDFFGGSLNGIREKLDYLAGLGVTVLYLNPIFQARSNHRYDTGDYERIDPLLGDEADFTALCSEALARGIRLMLDGVFSHTGADSRYFNKYGRYPEIGAYQEATGQGQSPYGNWYVFHQKGGQIFYDSWWGFQDLPSVQEHDLAYRAYIAGPDGIVRRWLRLGASGWRLDVSDELPDNFLRDLRRAIKAENPEAALLGEVWEDASCKISYGGYRDFLFGRTHDQIMGYPFQQALIGWLSGSFPAERLHAQLEILREHYPPPSFACSFNLISSHDIPRALTSLAGRPDPGSREAQASLFLSDSERQRGEALLQLAVLFQMIYPGCPVIYYGDETAMEGYRDPFNRRPFPWGKENQRLQAWFSRLGCWRRDWLLLRFGGSRMQLAAGDCLVLERSWTAAGADPDAAIRAAGAETSGPQVVLLAINRSATAQTIDLCDRQIYLQPYGCLLEADGINLLESGSAT